MNNSHPRIFFDKKTAPPSKLQELGLMMRPFGKTIRKDVVIVQEQESPSLQKAMREIAEQFRDEKKQERRFVARFLSIDYTPYANSIKDCWKIAFEVDVEVG